MLLKLFLSFAYIGTFTFGGGYAMLPMFQRILVTKNNWLTEPEMIEFFSISQCLPGVISTSTAVLVGYKQKGTLGSIAAVLGIVTPSVILIIIIASILSNLTDHPIASRAFMGLRVCVSVLILNAVINLWKNAIVDKPAIIIFALVFLGAILTSLPVALLIAFAGFSGIVIAQYRKIKNSESGGA
ncbi:MAG: chromate transporter [Oscillospiraceae bacterium]|nr:chromate transporter [Oscillospiraceae bacterium]